MTDEQMNADIMDKICGLLADYEDKLPIDRNINYLVLTQAAGAIRRLVSENERLRKTKIENSGPDAGSGIWMRK
jgi:hypothetical protein